MYIVFQKVELETAGTIRSPTSPTAVNTDSTLSSNTEDSIYFISKNDSYQNFFYFSSILILIKYQCLLWFGRRQRIVFLIMLCHLLTSQSSEHVHYFLSENTMLMKRCNDVSKLGREYIFMKSFIVDY